MTPKDQKKDCKDEKWKRKSIMQVFQKTFIVTGEAEQISGISPVNS